MGFLETAISYGATECWMIDRTERSIRDLISGNWSKNAPGGTIIHEPYTGAHGEFYALSNSTDALNLGKFRANFTNDVFSLTFWLKTGGGSYIYPIGNHVTTGSDGWYIEEHNNQIGFYVGNGQTGSAYNVTPGTWYMITVTCDGVGNSYQMYVDSILRTSRSGAVTHTATNGLGMGGIQGRSSGYPGAITLLTIYPSVLLNTTQMAALRTSCSVGLGNPTSPALPTYEDIVIRSNPSLFMPLDEQASSLFAKSIFGDEGDYIGSPTLNVAGPPKTGYSAMQFDGTNDYVRQTHRSELDVGTGEFAFEIWMKSNYNDTTYMAIMGRDHAATGNGQLMYTAPGTGVGRIYTAGVATSGTILLTDNNWHHIVYQRSGSNHQLWVDGVKDIDVVASGDTNLSGQTRIGVADGSSAVYFQGSMSGFAYYKHALTPAQIEQHFTVTPPAERKATTSIVRKSGPIGHWVLDDVGGGIVHAEIGQNGTYYGNPSLRVSGPNAVVPYGVSTSGAPNEFIEFDVIGLGQNQPQSIEFWIKPDENIDSTTLKYILENQSVAHQVLHFGPSTSMLTNEVVAIANNHFGNDDRTGWSGVTELDSEWHHFVLTYNGTQNGWKLYIDGIETAGTKISNSGGSFGWADGKWRLATVGGSFQAIDGLAAFSVYRRQLTDNEILVHYRVSDNLRATSHSPVSY